MNTNAPRTIATVCARGGSKGLPGKNLKLFAGRPLIVHTIEAALHTQGIDGVYVSTDDDEIAAVAEIAGAIVAYRRPAELATDEAGKVPVIEHLVCHLEAQGESIGRIVDLQPTSPLRDAADIAGAMKLHAPLVMSVSAATDNPYFNLVERGEGGFVRLSKGDGQVRRQDSPAVFAINGAIYVWQRDALSRAAVHGLWSVDALPYEMPRWKSVDIDDIHDFEYAQWLRSRHGAGGSHG